MKVVVIGKRNIVVAFIYIIMGKVLSRTANRWRGLLIIFPYFGDGSLSMKIVTRLVQNSYHIYKVEKALANISKRSCTSVTSSSRAAT
jgi:hypothetical protein